MSVNSLRGYRQDLEEFRSYLDSRQVEDLGQLTSSFLRGFLAQLHKKNKKSTVARKMAALRSCFTYAQRKGWIAENPLIQIRTPKIEKTIPPFLSEKEVESLLEKPVSESWLALRDQAFLELFYASGLRLSELTNLDWEALDLSLGLIRVIGKGAKERIVPVGRKAIRSLLDYRQALTQEEKGSDFQIKDRQAIFLNRFGERLSDRTIARRLKKKVLREDLSPSISPHALRHSFATHLLNAGADLRVVQELGASIYLDDAEIYAYQHEPLDRRLSKGSSQGVGCFTEPLYWPCVIRGKWLSPVTDK